MGCIQTKKIRETTQCIASKNKLYLDFDVDLYYNSLEKDNNENNIHRKFLDNENNNDNNSESNSETSFHL
jgi:hypothetical protein